MTGFDIVHDRDRSGPVERNQRTPARDFRWTEIPLLCVADVELRRLEMVISDSAEPANSGIYGYDMGPQSLTYAVSRGLALYPECSLDPGYVFYHPNRRTSPLTILIDIPSEDGAGVGVPPLAPVG